MNTVKKLAAGIFVTLVASFSATTYAGTATILEATGNVNILAPDIGIFDLYLFDDDINPIADPLDGLFIPTEGPGTVSQVFINAVGTPGNFLATNSVGTGYALSDGPLFTLAIYNVAFGWVGGTATAIPDSTGTGNSARVEFDVTGGDLYAIDVRVTDGSVQVVPIPAAAWLFGSGLIGLAGIARRKQATA